ncbi:hypothetical protein GGR54DRAFT_602613 [Hypoxylon sp. NC1633]|nr:hypothetical protein GGR54DRAFT_602613 [Hypoxylon sp. NC1633]
MRCRSRSPVTLSLLAGLVVGVLAGDIAAEIQRDFMGLFARQQQPITNFQQFQGALGDQKTGQIVQNTGESADKRPFQIVGGQSDGQTFTQFQAAASKICTDQKNACADLANSGGGAAFKVGDCDAQNDQCLSANKPTDQDDQFLYFCDD